jgi:oxalate decarboxylase
MYLEPGGIRELHWHQTAEWAIMTQGKCRITTLSREGKPSVEDVFKEDLWFFPAGLPHSLQGLGPDGAEFVLAFDDGTQSESNTLLLTDWFAHTPPDVLAKNFRVAQETFDDIPLHNLWIFPGDEPGDLEADQVAAGVEWGGTEPVIFRMSELKPVYENSGGSIRGGARRWSSKDRSSFGGHAARRRTSQTVAASRISDSASSQPPSMSWKCQNRLSGW